MASDDIRLVQIAALDCLVRPAAMAHSASPPLLCFLHGYDEGAPREIYAALTKHGPLRSGNSPVTEQFVIIAPQLPRRGDIWKLHVESCCGDHCGSGEEVWMRPQAHLFDRLQLRREWRLRSGSAPAGTMDGAMARRSDSGSSKAD